jgi:hypothetical protein
MYAYPPPAYDRNAPAPPAYQPPAGATKADLSQWPTEPIRRPSLEGEYTPPGPPPAALLNANQNGPSSTINDPYRP